MTYEEMKRRLHELLNQDTLGLEQLIEARSLANRLIRRVEHLESEVSDLSILVETRR